MKMRKKKSKMPKGMMKQEKVKASPPPDKKGTTGPMMSTSKADMVFQHLTKGKK